MASHLLVHSTLVTFVRETLTLQWYCSDLTRDNIETFACLGSVTVCRDVVCGKQLTGTKIVSRATTVFIVVFLVVKKNEFCSTVFASYGS